MNKTITIYELLELVKDGKAPKKIKYDGDKYTYNDCKGYEIDSSNYNLFETTITTSILNDTVEIIEDNDKLKKIEKEELFALDESMTKSSLVAWQKANNGIFKKQIDFLIDHINKIEEKLDEK